MRRITTVILTGLLLGASLVAGPSANAGFPGDNGKIAFSRFTKAQNDIWLLDPETGDTTRLTRTKRAREGLVDWNATGTRLAYSRCGRDEFSNCEIWTIGADGTDPTRLTFTPDVQETWPAWSPDGTKIAYTSNAEDLAQDIWMMNADGTGQTRLTTSQGFDAFPEWSPDGTRIAFTSDREAFDDIWVMDADGSNLMRLTTGNRKIDERPDWSPDGTQITFSRNGNIWRIDADGTDPIRLTGNRRFEFAPTYSPDGTMIAFNKEGPKGNGRFGVWIMNADGSQARQLTFGLFDFFPDWQPV